jgi:hypothetical protein
MSQRNDGHRLEEILAYDQGLLDDDDNAELEAHMRGCSECRATLSEVSESWPETHSPIGTKSLSADVYTVMMRSLGQR